MEKLLELEKRLKEYKTELEKNSMMGYGDVNGSLSQSEKHPDEKEDKRMIAEALDEHNEKKHNESKDEDSAYKNMKVKKGENEEACKAEMIKFDTNGQWSLDKSNSTTDNAQRIAPGARQPAKVDGTVVSPAQQVQAKKDKAMADKTKFEAEAKARREQYRKEGVLKTEVDIKEKDIPYSGKDKESKKPAKEQANQD